MKEKGLSESLVEQTFLVLDAVDGRIETLDVIKDTKYHNPEDSEAILHRIAAIQNKTKVKSFRDKDKMIKKEDVKKKNGSD